jgi:hypothetical protein
MGKLNSALTINEPMAKKTDRGTGETSRKNLNPKPLPGKIIVVAGSPILRAHWQAVNDALRARR